MQIVHIYNKKLEKVDSIYTTLLEEFQSNPQKFFTEWEKGYFVSDKELIHPIIEENTLREMTREECAKAGINVVLQEGEVLVNKKLTTIAKPSKWHKWNGKEWVVDLEEVKYKKIEGLKQIRDEKCKESLEMNGSLFQVRNTEDRGKFDRILLGIIAQVIKPQDIEEWRLADNTYKTFTYQELAQIPKLYSDREREVFKKFKELDEKLKKAETVEEIEKVEWI